MTEVKFYDPSFVPTGKLTYSVIAARYNGKWIIVRHNARTTWEIPGGHIEEGETPDEAASRELKEETGAMEFSLCCIATYSVDNNGSTGYGRLYFADVIKMDRIPGISEIAETMLVNDLPGKLTYADIQPILFRRIKKFIKENGSI